MLGVLYKKRGESDFTVSENSWKLMNFSEIWIVLGNLKKSLEFFTKGKQFLEIVNRNYG